MGPTYDERDPQPESLVDLGIKPASSDGSFTDAKPRRRRLSDLGAQSDEPPLPPETKPAGRPTLPTSAPPTESPSGSTPRRPVATNVAEASEPPELRPRAARPRIALALAEEETPGLQDIVDPPCLSDQQASREKFVEQSACELPASPRLSLALAGGLPAAVVGAVLWAFAALALGYHIGWMAIGVGVLVGGTVRVLGRGTTRSFGYWGAALSVFGCLLGNLLSVCAVMAGDKGLAPLAVLSHVGSNPVMIPAAMVATFSPLDLVFYGIAFYEGYRLSFRRVVPAEIDSSNWRG